jgi:hypothetical protein
MIGAGLKALPQATKRVSWAYIAILPVVSML